MSGRTFILGPKPLSPRQLRLGLIWLERAYSHVCSWRPPAPETLLLIRELISRIGQDLLELEKLRLREKGYRFP